MGYVAIGIRLLLGYQVKNRSLLPSSSYYDKNPSHAEIRPSLPPHPQNQKKHITYPRANTTITLRRLPNGSRSKLNTELEIPAVTTAGILGQLYRLGLLFGHDNFFFFLSFFSKCLDCKHVRGCGCGWERSQGSEKEQSFTEE